VAEAVCLYMLWADVVTVYIVIADVHLLRDIEC
jgi:hypothetical protein